MHRAKFLLKHTRHYEVLKCRNDGKFKWQLYVHYFPKAADYEKADSVELELDLTKTKLRKALKRLAATQDQLATFKLQRMQVMTLVLPQTLKWCG